MRAKGVAIIRTIGVCICANSHGVCGTRAHAHAPKIYANIACYTKTGVRSRIPYCVPARSVRRNAVRVMSCVHENRGWHRGTEPTVRSSAPREK